MSWKDKREMCKNNSCTLGFINVLEGKQFLKIHLQA